MTKKFIILVAIALFFTIPQASFALRCGSNLASVGDLKIEVLVACGEPFSKEVIGYIDQEKNGDRIRVMKVEEWILKEGNNYYSLVFEGNRLVKIESAGKEE